MSMPFRTLSRISRERSGSEQNPLVHNLVSPHRMCPASFSFSGLDGAEITIHPFPVTPTRIFTCDARVLVWLTIRMICAVVLKKMCQRQTQRQNIRLRSGLCVDDDPRARGCRQLVGVRAQGCIWTSNWTT